MGSGGVAIAALPTVICLKVPFSDGLGGGKMTEYNSPIMVGLSSLLLLLFLKIQFQSRVINSLSKTMFAVYLLQDGLAGQTAYKLLFQAFKNGQNFIVVIYVVLLFVLAFVTEKIRYPITKKLVNIINKKMQNFLWNKRKE